MCGQTPKLQKAACGNSETVQGPDPHLTGANKALRPLGQPVTLLYVLTWYQADVHLGSRLLYLLVSTAEEPTELSWSAAVYPVQMNI